MRKTSVIVAAAKPPGSQGHDLSAHFICNEIRERPSQMTLVDDRIFHFSEVPSVLAAIADDLPCALILVGPFDETDDISRESLAARAKLVVARVAFEGDVVQISARDPQLKQLIDTVQASVSQGDRSNQRTHEFRLLPAPADQGRPQLPSADGKQAGRTYLGDDVLDLQLPGNILKAATKWVHELLHAAAGRLFAEGKDGLESTHVPVRNWVAKRDPCTPLKLDSAGLRQAEADLFGALKSPDNIGEPLARLDHGLDLNDGEFKALVLVLGPELDNRHQNWITLLMDDPGRRVGTIGLYEELLAVPFRTSGSTCYPGRLARWRLFEGARDMIPAADAPIRLDPPLRAWLLGHADALQHDDAIEGIIRDEPWAGASLVADEPVSRGLIKHIEEGDSWLVLAGDGGPAAWRALLEAGIEACNRRAARADLRRISSLNASDSWDAGMRLARYARLSDRLLLLDASGVEEGGDADAALQSLLAAIGTEGGLKGAIVASDPARICRLLGSQEYWIESKPPSAEARLTALSRAALKADAHFTHEAVESLANLYPLQIDGIDHALRVAIHRPLGDGPEAARARFITACKEVSAEGASGLAQRIEPIFDLPDVVLPPDRKSQLEEIVDNVRFAPKVLEGWKFRDQLPYGLGVTALFHGPSGTGKTMASMAVAKALGIQILRIDLSRVVSKYIGDTEKNIDRIFQEAQLSGAALLIDEADGLLARRSEVKDAHDRYANIEVAYLLQRMEAFEGLAILTTNLRQNLDSAFLRRLRFIVDFPRPDASAREEIWRRCLPPESHKLGDATFRLLGRRIELTGGSIRQITLRAAFLAAAAGTKINSAHVAHAARAEFAKLGLPPVELDLVEGQAAA